jgi:ABC-type multidrug transport system, ATPase component
MTSSAPIEINNLRMAYGSFVAVDDLSLSVKKNSFTGLLGPNGAGKSTTLKTLTGLQKPTSGAVLLNGIDVVKNPRYALEDVGVVIETPEFYLYLTPRETFKYVGELLEMKHEAIISETEEILEKVKMTEWADKKLGSFSKGMRQRIALGQALLNDPSIILLDEPTSGLDPRGMAEIREILKALRNTNHDLTILMSSHILHEVSDLCDRIAMVNHGKLIIHDDMSRITANNNSVMITAKSFLPVDENTTSAINRMPGVLGTKKCDEGIEIMYTNDKESQSQLMASICSLNAGIYSFTENEKDLESVYLDLIKESR